MSFWQLVTKSARLFVFGALMWSFSPPAELRAEITLAPDADIPGLAAKLHDDLRAIGEAFDLYRKEKGGPPGGLEDLVKGGFLTALPAMAAILGEGNYAFSHGYDNMDGVGESDTAVYTTPYLPLPICEEFNRRYAPAPLNDGTVFDYQAAGELYPQRALGLDVKAFAVKWSTADTNCEIIQVLEYK